MAYNHLSFLLIFVGLYSRYETIKIGTTIKCYECRYPDPNCKDPFDTEKYQLVECGRNRTKCMKYMWQFSALGPVYYARQCSANVEIGRKDGRDCIERVGDFETKLWFCGCDNRDGCNGVDKINIPLNYLLRLLLPIHLFKQYIL
ncbi:hypothetical protein SNEBB_005418 [Seison nebaliae]|nr:hypothetical protein SNEBB_005418 [Seison nebaliae]